jgi:hypothetical protein
LRTIQEAAESHFEELVDFIRLLNPGVADCALPPFMAVALYGDESESHEPHVFTLAGFVASPSAWENFIPAWREMLCSVGPYPVEALHTNVLERGRPPFDGWVREEREALIARAVDILTDTTLCANLYAISCTFMLDELNDRIPCIFEKAKTQEIYERCYRVVFENILKFSPFKGIDFIFDRKAKVEGRVQAHFEAAKAELDKDPDTNGRLNECIFRDDRKFMPLQAADLLAFEIRRRVWDKSRDASAPLRPTYQKLKDVFAKTHPAAKPPYRQRIFRCYNGKFIDDVMGALAAPEHQPINAADVWYLWNHMDAPED